MDMRSRLGRLWRIILRLFAKPKTYVTSQDQWFILNLTPDHEIKEWRRK